MTPEQLEAAARKESRLCYSITKNDRIKRKIRDFKSSMGMIFHAIWWRFLWATKLARPYSKFLCRMGWYTQYQKGRCGYCGEELK